MNRLNSLETWVQITCGWVINWFCEVKANLNFTHNPILCGPMKLLYSLSASHRVSILRVHGTDPVMSHSLKHNSFSPKKLRRRHFSYFTHVLSSRVSIIPLTLGVHRNVIIKHLVRFIGYKDKQLFIVPSVILAMAYPLFLIVSMLKSLSINPHMRNLSVFWH